MATLQYEQGDYLPPEWIAYFRSLTDIPYAQEIAAVIDAAAFFHRQVTDPAKAAEHLRVLTPRFEQRFNSLTWLARERGSKQILELAVGYSSRGLLMTEDAAVTYTETDLAPRIQKKQECTSIVLLGLGQRRSNLTFAEADAFSYADLLKACGTLPGRITVITEGLLMWYSLDAQLQIARNIHDLLCLLGGVWITTDIATGEDRDRSYGGVELTYSGLVRRNSFKDDAEVKAFLVDAGFKAEVFLQREFAGTLTCIDRLGLPVAETSRMLEDRKLYCLDPQ